MNRFWLLCLLAFIALQVHAEPPSVTDDLGNDVTLDAPARRIVSLAPHITEMLFGLGVGDRIVATVRYSDYPEAASKIPVLGDAFSLSLEAVIELHPDLVIAWSTGGNQRTVARLKELGIPVYQNEAASLEDIASNLERLGVLTGEPARGAELARQFRQGLAGLRSKRTGDATRVFFQISDAQLYTVNDEHLIGEALSTCHAKNVFGHLSIPVPLVSLESVLAANPEVILVARPHKDFVSRWAGEWQRLGWQGKIRYIDASLITRPGFRMLQGIKTLCKLL